MPVCQRALPEEALVHIFMPENITACMQGLPICKWVNHNHVTSIKAEREAKKTSVACTCQQSSNLHVKVCTANLAHPSFPLHIMQTSSKAEAQRVMPPGPDRCLGTSLLEEAPFCLPANFMAYGLMPPTL